MCVQEKWFYIITLHYKKQQQKLRMNSEDFKIMGGASVPTHEKVMKINTKQLGCSLSFSSQ